MAAIEAKKTDRRVIRTRSAIRKAFTDLLAETAYSKITITALAKRADVDRKTFYTHYSSVDNLLEDVIRTQTETSLEGIDFRDFIADPPACTKRFLIAIEASFPFTREQLRTVAENVPLDQYLTYWTAAAKDHIRKEAVALPAGSERNIDIMLEFYLGGILNAYLYLLRNCPDTSLDEAVSLIGQRGVRPPGNPGTPSQSATLIPNPKIVSRIPAVFPGDDCLSGIAFPHFSCSKAQTPRPTGTLSLKPTRKEAP